MLSVTFLLFSSSDSSFVCVFLFGQWIILTEAEREFVTILAFGPKCSTVTGYWHWINYDIPYRYFRVTSLKSQRCVSYFIDCGDVSLCRCAVGQDWWYYGNMCQFRSSVKNNIITAVTASIIVFVIMLAVTVVSVVCVKKKSQRKVTLLRGGITLENLHTFKAWYFAL